MKRCPSCKRTDAEFYPPPSHITHCRVCWRAYMLERIAIRKARKRPESELGRLTAAWGLR